ncbi:MAG: hypothetical protein RMA76_08020 [Deltaproteobacteria bacterium]|jgi:hypothetical protein
MLRFASAAELERTILQDGNVANALADHVDPRIKEQLKAAEAERMDVAASDRLEARDAVQRDRAIAETTGAEPDLSSAGTGFDPEAQQTYATLRSNEPIRG